MSTKRIAFCGVMAALAIVFGYVEHLVPFPVGIYGLKLGLSNLVVVVLLYSTKWHIALSINLLRIFICFLLFGSATSLLFSLFGGIISFFVMFALISLSKERFSAVGVSICGAVAHNVGQICAAVILLDEIRIAFYLPVLIGVGALTGTLIGLISLPIIKRSRSILK
jgi:heptaprenyl diphosphate synthase